MTKITIKDCKVLHKDFKEYCKKGENDLLLKTYDSMIKMTIQAINKENINNDNVQEALNNMFSVILTVMKKDSSKYEITEEVKSE